MAEPTYDSVALAAALSGSRRLSLADGTSVALTSAIVLDLDGKGVETLGRAKGGIRYDLDNDGLADRTSWIGPSDGFLFLDRDGNGTVSNAAEFDLSAGGRDGASALPGLRTYDSNNDGVFSALDARFADFRVWQDRNGNGVADTGEVQTLGTAGVRSITLPATANTATQNGDAVGVVATGGYTRTNGTSGAFADVVLTYSSARVDGLPTLAFAAAIFDRKSSKYRVSAKDGRMLVAERKGGAVIDARAGGMIGSFTMTFKQRAIGMLTAIVLDLDGDGVTTKSLEKSRGWFDMNGDGSPDRQGWAGPRDGFLVIDRNGDGIINDGSELGFLAEDANAGGSLAALAKLDSNRDKVLDASDARFGELRVWIDANGNGVTDQGELKTLAELKIKSVGLDQRTTADRVKPGQNLTLATTTFTYENGMARTAGDVALAFRPSPRPEAAVVAGPADANPFDLPTGLAAIVIGAEADSKFRAAFLADGLFSTSAPIDRPILADHEAGHGAPTTSLAAGGAGTARTDIGRSDEPVGPAATDIGVAVADSVVPDALVAVTFDTPAPINRPLLAEHEFWHGPLIVSLTEADSATPATADTRAQDLLAQAATQLNLGGQGVLNIGTGDPTVTPAVMIAPSAAPFRIG